MKTCRSKAREKHGARRLLRLALAAGWLGWTAWAAALEPPANVTATAGDYTNRVNLTWEAAAGASNYFVFRHTGDVAAAASLAADTTNLFYDDAGAVPGVYYYYWVQAGDGLTNSGFSAGAMGYCRLAAPRDLTAGTGTLCNAVALAWAPAAYSVKYQVWRHTATNDEASAILLTNTASTACLDESAWPVKRYVYRVRAVADSGAVGEFSESAEGWRRPAAARDYDLDGKADLVLYNAVDQTWRAYVSGQNYAETLFNFGGLDFAAICADYDGDGRADPAVYKESSGMWAVLMSRDAYRMATLDFGGEKYRPVAGDFDGDGIADPAVYNEEQGVWRVRPSSLTDQDLWIEFGGRGWRPAPADYDGDGLTDPALQHEGQGVWLVLSSAAQYAPVRMVFGGPEYRPVSADYDGDGKADPAVYHTSSGKWVVMMSGAEYAMVSVLWGGAGCRPEPADYDGDGKADPMVRQVASGVWGVMFSGSHYAGMQATLGGAGGAWRPVSATCNQSFYFLCFGDSITYGYGSSSQGPETGYPILLENKLNENFGDYFVSINVGKDGEDTDEGVGRFPVMLDTYVPQLVLLMEGINDLGGSSSYSQVSSNLRSMIGAAQDRGIPVVLATISPVISTALIDRSAQYARILEFNPYIYDIAADLNIPVAQVYEAITAVSGWQSSLIEQESANHPNDAGYQYVRDAFYSVVASGINSGLYY